MKAIVALLLGVAFAKVDQNPYSKLVMKDAWKQEITFDWKELDHAASFEAWKEEFGKTYKCSDDETKHFITFLENWEMINDFNVRAEESYTMRMNQFGDLTPDEFKLYVHGHSGSCMKHRSVAKRVKMTPITPRMRAMDAPTSVDWTNVDGKSYVTAVKNQGQCGSCWAFSTTGSIESRTAIANKQTGSDIQTLSEQQLVDCSKAEGNEGCNGGLMDDAFKYVEKVGGLCSEEEYPYKAKDGTCEASKCSKTYDDISAYTDVTADSEQSLEAAVAAGPVSIAIEADQSAFQFYSTGVVTGKCGDRLDHGVLVVGYGEEKGTQYWKVKNSWGDTWGQDGYVLLCRDCDKNEGKGECGILMSPSFPAPKSN